MPERLKVVVTADFDAGELARLAELAEVQTSGWGVTGTIPTEEETIALLVGADVLAVSWEPVTDHVLERTSLSYIASVRGGPGGNIDLEAAARRGIPVTGTAGREAIPVAEFTFGLMLGFFRFIPQTHGLLKSRELASFDPQPDGDIGWGMEPNDPWMRFRGEDLARKAIGLVGLGTVGRLVATRAAAFGMTVLGHDPFVEELDGVELVGLDELTARADVVSMHARYGPSTHHLLGREQLAAMKPTALLVNTARPDLVDRAALLEALQAGSIAGAALDVHGKEPIDPDDPFLALENVICTPHIAGSTHGATKVQSIQVVDNIARFIAGEALETQVA